MKCDLENKPIEHMVKEDDNGNAEYKLKLVNPTLDRVDHLTT